MTDGQVVLIILGAAAAIEVFAATIASSATKPGIIRKAWLLFFEEALPLEAPERPSPVAGWRHRLSVYLRGLFLPIEEGEEEAEEAAPSAPSPAEPEKPPLDPDADVLWVREFTRALAERQPTLPELGGAYLDAWARVATRARDESGYEALGAAFVQLAETSQRTVGVEAFEPAAGSRVDAETMEAISGPAAGVVVETLRLGLRSRAEVLRKALVRTAGG